jgi:DNA-binding transcriptional LysR family regulator
VAADALSSLQGEFRGQLHIGVVSPAHYFAPRMITAFRAQYPEVRIRLTVGKRDPLLQMLAEHQIDLMLAGYPPAQTEVESEAFARHPHCLVARPDHPLARRTGITWQDLRDEPFIFREVGSATRQFLEHLLQTQGLQVNADLELDGNETVKQAVMAGMGISFLSAHVFQLELEAGKMAVLDVAGLPKWLDWCVLSRREQAVPAIRQAFREFVLTEGMHHASCRVSNETSA